MPPSRPTLFKALLLGFALALGSGWGGGALAAKKPGVERGAKPMSKADRALAALSTHAERTGFEETGRYEEVESLCRAFARARPAQVRCFEFGRTPQGRTLWALVAQGRGKLSPSAVQAARLPVLLVQGAIHAGEVDGKDAGFWALRELLQADALRDLAFVFVPVFNADGHERFGRWNRPNQRGPAAMGWRTTAQNHNLNRDYAKAETPEMQAMHALVRAWDPLVTLDLHATDGAQFRHDIAVMVEPLQGHDETLRAPGLQLREGLMAGLRKAGSQPLGFYPSFVVDDDPSSGFRDSVSPPRFSSGYFPLRNRWAVLVETHSWQPYPARVKATRDTVLTAVELLRTHGPQWRAQVLAADARAERLGGERVPVQYAASERVRTIDFLGYAYSRLPSEVSGQLMTRYDETQPALWRLPLRDELLPSRWVQAPRAGYWVPPEHAAQLAPRLAVHGIRFETLKTAVDEREVEAFRAEGSQLEPRSTEGHQRVQVRGAWQTERTELPAGGLYVPIAQPLSRLVIALLEPEAPDAYMAWGDFNIYLERREYMEAYVAEQVAREQLAADPALRAAFEARLASDAAFRADPAARLDFFYRRHPSWDRNFARYPVLRLQSAP